MKQLIIAIGFLMMVSVANSQSTQPTPSEKPSFVFSSSFNIYNCTESRDTVPAEDLPLSGILVGITLTIEERGQFFDVSIINRANGHGIYMVQSREDFMNNSSTNVENIEFQWPEDHPTDEGPIEVELIDQEVNEEVTYFNFKASFNGCFEFLSVSMCDILERCHETM